ncbi:MAG: type II secretion system protein [Phycisphaerae bacterium]
MSKTGLNSAPPPRGGFTLIELLTVIVIIALLLTILVPTIKGIIMQGYAAKTRARINALSNGAYAYYEDTARRFYPGQQYSNWSVLPTAPTTGSQVLALCLFSPKPGVTGVSFPTDVYASYTPDILFTSNGKNNTIADTFPDTMPICYYPSHIGNTGVGQFFESDNSAYTSGAVSPNSPGFNAFITNQVTNNAYCDGSFLIIAPGTARKYFDQANVTNFR